MQLQPFKSNDTLIVRNTQTLELESEKILQYVKFARNKTVPPQQ